MMVAAINIAGNIFTMRFQFHLVGHLVALERQFFASAPLWTNALKTNRGPRLRRPDPTLDEVIRGCVSHPAEDARNSGRAPRMMSEMPATAGAMELLRGLLQR
jgi:hypothetical protein